MRRGIGVALLGSALLFAARPASAQDDKQARAAKLSDEAAELGAKGQYEGAIEKFKAADALVRKPVNACNIGLAYVRLSLWDSAHYYLARCKKTWTDGALPSWVNRRLSESKAALKRGQFARLDIKVSPAVAVVRVDPVPGEQLFENSLWLRAGTYSVSVSAPGYQSVTRQVIITGKRQRALTVNLSVKPEAPVDPKPPVDPPVDPKPPVDPNATGTGTTKADPGQTDPQPRPLDQPVVTGEQGSSRKSAYLWAGIGSGVVAGALLVVGIGTVIDANDLVDQADDRCDALYGEDPNDCPPETVATGDKEEIYWDTVDNIDSKKRTAYILYGVSGAAAVASGVLLYLWLGSESSPEDRPQISTSVSRDGGAVQVGWSF